MSVVGDRGPANLAPLPAEILAAVRRSLGRTIVVLASGQSNMRRTVPHVWAPPANATVLDWDGTEGGTGTRFIPLSPLQANLANFYAAELARRHPCNEIFLINISWGGLPIEHWLSAVETGPDMFAILARVVPQALAIAGVDHIDHMLWAQGESNMHDDGDRHSAAFSELNDRLREQSWFRPDTPLVLFAIAPASINGIDSADRFNAVLANLVRDDPDRRKLIHTADLPWVDEYHLSVEGQERAARRAVDVMERGLGRASVDAKDVAGGVPVFDTVRSSQAHHLSPLADLNALVSTGFHVVVNPVNGPGPGWWYIVSMRHSEAYQIQIAFALGDAARGLCLRNRISDEWTPWSWLTASHAGPLQLPVYSRRNQPSLRAGQGSLSYIVDGDQGYPCLAVHDGKRWRRVSLGRPLPGMIRRWAKRMWKRYVRRAAPITQG